MNAFHEAFAHYFDFRGRMRRRSYWSFIIGSHLVLIALCLPALIAVFRFLHELVHNEATLDLIAQLLRYVEEGFSVSAEVNTQAVIYALQLHTMQMADQFFAHPLQNFPCTCVCTLLAVCWTLLITIPTYSATARRLRDAGQSPWWCLAVILCWAPLKLVAYIAVLPSIVTIVLCCFPSELPPAPERKSA